MASGLEETRVDHLVAGVAEDARDDLDATVVAVEADLGHEHPSVEWRRRSNHRW